MKPFRETAFWSARIALLGSAALLALSILLMTGATYAWMSDSVVNRGNVLRCADSGPASCESEPVTDPGGEGDPVVTPIGDSAANGSVTSDGDSEAAGDGSSASAPNGGLAPGQDSPVAPGAVEGGGLELRSGSASEMIFPVSSSEQGFDLVPKRIEREG
ncbi:hypothetical protein C1879_07785 [Paraeggerthella hongkongensis]|uniref:hypothetical protein n=1 Tax=Paraeggerthella sp. TaxID=2897350 RepID=UPI000DF796F2|nr:hypothetical protein C1879_07785 [Paraeggerthella hongkongensis]